MDTTPHAESMEWIAAAADRLGTTEIPADRGRFTPAGRGKKECQRFRSHPFRVRTAALRRQVGVVVQRVARDQGILLFRQFSSERAGRPPPRRTNRKRKFFPGRHEQRHPHLGGAVLERKRSRTAPPPLSRERMRARVGRDLLRAMGERARGRLRGERISAAELPGDGLKSVLQRLKIARAARDSEPSYEQPGRPPPRRNESELETTE
jgi:hypothetical protein